MEEDAFYEMDRMDAMDGMEQTHSTGCMGSEGTNQGHRIDRMGRMDAWDDSLDGGRSAMHRKVLSFVFINLLIKKLIKK